VLEPGCLGGDGRTLGDPGVSDLFMRLGKEVKEEEWAEEKKKDEEAELGRALGSSPACMTPLSVTSTPLPQLPPSAIGSLEDRLSVPLQIAECKAHIAELRGQKAALLEQEDFIGAHQLKQRIEDCEQNLLVLRRHLDAMPTPLRRVSAAAEIASKSPVGAMPGKSPFGATPMGRRRTRSPEPTSQLCGNDTRNTRRRLGSGSGVEIMAAARQLEDEMTQTSEDRGRGGIVGGITRMCYETLNSDEQAKEDKDESIRQEDEEVPEDVERTEEHMDACFEGQGTSAGVAGGAVHAEQPGGDGTEVGQWQSTDASDTVELAGDTESQQELPFALPRETFDRLYGYQRTGVAWMARIWQSRQGGILADEMGLGKTVQVCAFLNGARKAGATHALLLLPVSLLDQWAKEARQWCPGWPVHVYYGTAAERSRALRRVSRPPGGILLTSYALLGNPSCGLFEVAVADAPSPLRRGRRKQSKRRRFGDDDDEDVGEDSGSDVQLEPELPPGELPRSGSTVPWDVVICDEAHRMKNISTVLGKSLRHLRSNCRLLLTGTPMQNALQDLWALMDFAQPGLLGNHATFVKHFSEPIDRGSVRGATPFQVELKKHLSEQLRSLMGPHFLRRSKANAGLLGAGCTETGAGAEDVSMEEVTPEDRESEAADAQAKKLKPKLETIVWLAPSEQQVAAYRDVLDKSEVIREACAKQKLGIEVFRAIGLLKRLCNHPALLMPCPKPSSWVEFLAEATNPSTLAQDPVIGAAATLQEPVTNSDSGCVGISCSTVSAGNGCIDSTSQPQALQQRSASNGVDCIYEGGQTVSYSDASVAPGTNTQEPETGVCADFVHTDMDAPCQSNESLAWVEGGTAAEADNASAGSVVEATLAKLARSAEAMLEQSSKLKCLAYLLPALASRGHRTLVFSQSLKMLDLVQLCCLKPSGLRCLRIDGSTDALSRADKVAKFQRQRERFQCMLLTTNVGGVGLNLTSADRVILVDPAWNPALDAQAVDRAFRIGQEREVRVYRLIMSGLIEDKMFRLQVFKMGLTKTALEGDQQQRYFTSREIRALFDWTDPAQGETRRLLAEKHGSAGEELVRQHADEDGASDGGWMAAGPAVGISDFAALYGLGAPEEEPDMACSAQVEEAKQKLLAADEKLQRMLDARRAAEEHRDGVSSDLEDAANAFEQMREKRTVAEEVIKDKRSEVAQSRRAEVSAQQRLEKVGRARAGAQDQLLRAAQAVALAEESAGVAASAAQDACSLARSTEQVFVKAISDAEKQVAAVDVPPDCMKKAHKALERLRAALDTLDTRQAELEITEDELARADADRAAAEVDLVKLCSCGDSTESDLQGPIAKKTAELTQKKCEKECLKCEPAVVRAQQKVEAARDVVLQSVQLAVEAGMSFIDSFQKAAMKSAKLKASLVSVKAALKSLPTTWASVKKAREGSARAGAARRKTVQRSTATVATRVNAECFLAGVEREYAEAAAEEDARRAARGSREAQLASAELARGAAEAEEAEAKRRRDELKIALPLAKEAVKVAARAERDAVAERQALHTACSKVERAQLQMEEAKNSATHILCAEEYDTKQVTGSKKMANGSDA